MASWCFMKHQENGLATQTLKRKSHTLMRNCRVNARKNGGFDASGAVVSQDIPPFIPPIFELGTPYPNMGGAALINEHASLTRGDAKCNTSRLRVNG